MTPPPRRPPRARARSSSRIASLFFGLGCLTILGVTFALGVAAGRRWPEGLPGLRGVRTVATAAPVTPAERDRRPENRSLDKDKTRPATEAPVLTFYRDLTAPLAPAPAPAAKPIARPAARPPEPVATKPVVLAESGARDRAPAAPSPETRPAADARFTIQVGAFKTRAQADAVRARLAASGGEVYVTEVDAGGAIQYRVRVGNFATREAAREMAARLAAERQVATYVTTR